LDVPYTSSGPRRGGEQASNCGLDKGRDFVYGLKSVADAAATVGRLAADGVHTGNAGMDLRVQRAYNHNGHPRWSLGLAGIPLRVQHPITKKVRKCRAILNRRTTTV
jgi:hypothetical protein